MALNQQANLSQKRTPLNPKWAAAQDAVVEIRNTFGFMPDFINSLTEQSVPGLWNEVKNLFYNPQTAIDFQTKNLIAVGVASQIPCDLLVHYHRALCTAEAVSEQKVSEAILMTAITRHWSTVLNGSQIDRDEFRNEANQMMDHVARMMEKMGGRLPPEENFLVNFSSVDETYKDIEKTFGLVPRFFQMFPDEGISGAWSEFKGVQLNPHTGMSGKHKELLGLAVASQIPCDYCIYFHRNVALLNGATDREIKEAIAMGAMTRHWSTIFHGVQFDSESMMNELDKLVKNKGGRGQALHS